MNVIFERKTLVSALGVLKPAVQKNAILPALQHVHLRAAEGQAEWTATNLGLSMLLTVAAEVDVAGEMCVHYATLSDIVGKVQDDKIRLALAEDGSCAVSGTSFDCTVATHPVDEFPSVVFGPDEVHPELARVILLRDGIARIKRAVSPFAATSDARPVLTGLHWMVRELWEDSAPHLYVEAADGFRLAQLRLSEFEVEGNASALDHQVSPRFISLLERADAEDVVLWFYPELQNNGEITHSGYVVAQVGPLWVRDSLIEGNFPATTSLIGTTEKRLRVTLPVEPARAALNLTQVYSNAVAFVPDPTASLVQVRALNSDRGKCALSLPATIAGVQDDEAPFAFGLAARFFMDALNAMRGENMTLEIDSPDTPCRIVDGRVFKAVIMPMTITENTETEKTEEEPAATTLRVGVKVLRREDGAVLRDGFETIDEAELWLFEQIEKGALEPADTTAYEIAPYVEAEYADSLEVSTAASAE